MDDRQLTVTYIGGPTALIEFAGARLLTDPTFDPAGEQYPTGIYTLQKTADPAIPARELRDLDAILLSHDHHFDNLDRAGRALLASATPVITTPIGAQRLGRTAIGLRPWDHLALPARSGRILQITGTPARHGPPDGDRGPVVGFVLNDPDIANSSIYVSGDTVWYEGIEQVSRRFAVRVALLFMGAARVPEVGPAHLTFTAEEAVEAARAFADATIIPLHYEGWAHFSESRAQIDRQFALAGLAHRLCWLAPGRPTLIEMPERAHAIGRNCVVPARVTA